MLNDAARGRKGEILIARLLDSQIVCMYLCVHARAPMCDSPRYRDLIESRHDLIENRDVRRYLNRWPYRAYFLIVRKAESRSVTSRGISHTDQVTRNIFLRRRYERASRDAPLRSSATQLRNFSRRDVFRESELRSTP